MHIPTALEILKQCRLEIDKVGYQDNKDRPLAMIDAARISLCPPAGRTPDVHTALTKACQEAYRELAKTIIDKELSEPEAYIVLHGMGEIKREVHADLVDKTVARLEGAIAPQKALESA